MNSHELLREEIKSKAVVHGKVILSSGKEADYYVDLRRITLDHIAAPLVGQVMLDLTKDLDYEAVGGLTLGADPVATAMMHVAASQGRALDSFVVRKAEKAHGLQRRIEGPDVKGKRVFLRCDLNVPLKDGKITDDGRIRASLPTINILLNGGASLAVAAHLGRPKGEVKSDLSLAPVAKRLAELLGVEVIFASSMIGAEVSDLARDLKTGQILLLENIRFSAAETSKDDTERLEFAKQLASLADVYVGDGFGAVHRKHASVFDLPKLLPHAAGTLISAEVEVLKKLTQNPERPYGVVLGGAKVSDKIGVISNLLNKVDVMAIGGGMVFTFLAAQGKEIGTSLVEIDLIDKVKELIIEAAELGVKLVLPTDILVAEKFVLIKNVNQCSNYQSSELQLI